MEIGYTAASTVPGIRLLSSLTLVLDVQTRLAGRSERVMRIFVERGKAMSVPKVHKDTVRQKAKVDDTHFSSALVERQMVVGTKPATF